MADAIRAANACTIEHVGACGSKRNRSRSIGLGRVQEDDDEEEEGKEEIVLLPVVAVAEHVRCGKVAEAANQMSIPLSGRIDREGARVNRRIIHSSRHRHT